MEMDVKTYKKITTTSRYTCPTGRTRAEDIGSIMIKSDIEYDDFETYHLWQNLNEEQRKNWYDSHRIEDVKVLETENGDAFILKDVYDLIR